MKNIFVILLMISTNPIYPMEPVNKKQERHTKLIVTDKTTINDDTNNDTITCNPRVRQFIVRTIRRYFPTYTTL
jgi:lauroyl/myristoyl acyltransferase